jgi:hypothetical protein
VIWKLNNTGLNVFTKLKGNLGKVQNETLLKLYKVVASVVVRVRKLPVSLDWTTELSEMRLSSAVVLDNVHLLSCKKLTTGRFGHQVKIREAASGTDWLCLRNSPE